MFRIKDADRFNKKFAKGSPGECWIWTASCTEKRMGYGAFGVGKSVMRAHRVAYLMYVGEIPDGLCVLHECDNPKCVNPEHLFLGTYQDNSDDKAAKGRSSRKLSPQQVSEIRESSLSTRKLAKLYGVCQTMVRNVKNRTAWSHI